MSGSGTLTPRERENIRESREAWERVSLQMLEGLSRLGAGAGMIEQVDGKTFRRRAGSVIGANTTVLQGDTIANTAAETDFATQWSIGANSLAAGDVLQIKASGLYSTAVVGPTLTAKLKLGVVPLLSTGAMTSILGSVSALPWSSEVWVTICSTGNEGKAEAHGQTIFGESAFSGKSTVFANGAQATIDTTQVQMLSLAARWGAASASNTITLRQFVCLRFRA